MKRSDFTSEVHSRVKEALVQEVRERGVHVNVEATSSRIAELIAEYVHHNLHPLDPEDRFAENPDLGAQVDYKK